MCLLSPSIKIEEVVDSLRQLKAEIALIADEVEKINALPSGCYHSEVIPIVIRLRQLSVEQ